MAEETILTTSMLNNERQPKLKRKYFIDIQDDNNGAYQAGQVKFTTTNLLSSTDFASYAESEFHIPVPIEIAVGGTMKANIGGYALTVKNSVCDFLNSVSMKWNTIQKINPCDLSNLVYNY